MGHDPARVGLLEDCKEYLVPPPYYQQTAPQAGPEAVEAKPKLFGSCANRVPADLDWAELCFEGELSLKGKASVKRERSVEHDLWAYSERKPLVKDEPYAADVPYIKQEQDVKPTQSLQRPSLPARSKKERTRAVKHEPYDVPARPVKQEPVETRIKREPTETYGLPPNVLPSVPPQHYPYIPSADYKSYYAPDLGGSQAYPVIKSEFMDVDIKPPVPVQPPHVQQPSWGFGVQQPVYPTGYHRAQVSRSHSAYMQVPTQPYALRAHGTW